MSWKREPEFAVAFLDTQDSKEEREAKHRASRVWVASLGIEDSVVREAIESVRATSPEELKAKIESGDLLRQRGMGPARMARARWHAKCEWPEPSSKIKIAALSIIGLCTRPCAWESDLFQQDLKTMFNCLKVYNNVTDMKTYHKDTSVLMAALEVILKEQK